MKLVTTETQTFTKGVAYNLADGDLNLPKGQYIHYFDNIESHEADPDGEWMAMDRCKKSFKVVTKTYS